MLTIHCQLDVGGLLTSDDAELRKIMPHIKDGDGYQFTDLATLKMALVGLLSKGVKFLPFGEPCDGWDYATGCPGHDEEIAQ